mgnify:CR=1 FL=1
MLAHEGYTVLELGYNLAKYGQKELFNRHPQTDPLTLEYFEMAARRLLRRRFLDWSNYAVKCFKKCLGTLGP